ncbi:MAG: hypothetical protein GY788_16130 [bacterium]|nr:hypothetical protein [bacterium]
MMQEFGGRWLVLIALVVLLLPACGDSDVDGADTTQDATDSTTTTLVVTTTTAAPPAATEDVSVTELPGEGDPWDVLSIGAEELLTRLPGELYADHLADALSVEVRLDEPFGADHAYATTLVQQLSGDRWPSLEESVPPAEVIVLLARPGGPDASADDHIEDDFLACWWTPLAGEPPTTDLTDSYWAEYRQTLDDIYSELWTLRENQSTVIIALDLYNAKLPAQQEGGIEAECIAWFESWREQASQAAEANGAHFVSLQDIFNGETHDLDPAAAGLTGPSDADPGAPIWRSTPTGAALHAEALITATLEALSQR